LAELLIYYHPSECSSHRSSTIFFNKVSRNILVQIDKWNTSRLELNRNSCDGASKENLYFNHQSKQVFIFSSLKFLKDVLHVSIELQKYSWKLGELVKAVKTLPCRLVFQQHFSFSQTSTQLINLPRKSRANNLIVLV